MNPQRLFIRKIIYVVAIGLLLIPLFLLARPTSTDRPGGVLAQLRSEQGLSQAQLGEIDPASETIKLATLGMRGVAANILWVKAHNYKKKKNWTNLAATLNQITLLEPNFIAVWRFQAWNLSYNVSAEFDDYRERYRWVIKGIEFLIRGISYNEHNPRLAADVGWFISQKIGRADERKEFRELFKKDDEFHKRHGTPSVEQRDNWLVGKKWYAKAEVMVRQGADLQGMSELIFYEKRPKCQMNYAENLEEDGIFGERARQAWSKAVREWVKEYGNSSIETSFKTEDGQPLKISLTNRERLTRQIAALKEKMIALEPGLYKRLRLKRWDRLTDEEKGAVHFWMEQIKTNPRFDRPEGLAELEERYPNWQEEFLPLRRAMLTKKENEVLDTPTAMRDEREEQIARRAMDKLYEAVGRTREKLIVSLSDLARQIHGAKRSEAFKLAEQVADIRKNLRIIDNYRQVVNFEYWRHRAEFEQTAEARTARESIYQGRRAFKDGLLPEANEKFLKGMAEWRALLERKDFAALANDRDTVDDLTETIKSYANLLRQRDAQFPPDFPLAEFVHQQLEKDAGGRSRSAREAAQYARQRLASGDTAEAKKAYEAAIKVWGSLLKEDPSLVLMADRITGEAALDAINKYAGLLMAAKEPFPEDFPLTDFLHFQLEHAEETVAAREHIRQAIRHRQKSEFPEAQKQFEEALGLWKKLVDRFPSVRALADPALAGEIVETAAGYKQVLDLRGQKFPQDFPLNDFLKRVQAAQK